FTGTVRPISMLVCTIKLYCSSVANTNRAVHKVKCFVKRVWTNKVFIRAAMPVAFPERLIKFYCLPFPDAYNIITIMEYAVYTGWTYKISASTVFPGPLFICFVKLYGPVFA